MRLRHLLKRWKDVFQSRPWLIVLLGLLALFLQNGVIFRDHYTSKAFFPYDFPETYYALVAFWTTAVREGFFPQWMPYDNMGYPFAMALQSGFYYPPLWVFTLSDHLPYSIHAAIIVQCLHVLWGAVGVFVFVHLLTRASSIALLSAIAFQFFGGFYSNAQHPDIIRAYAWLPWLFYSTHLVSGQVRLTFRNVIAPLIVYCSISGSYQGNLISHLAFLFGVRFLFLFQSLKSHRPIRTDLSVLVLICLGIGLSTIYLLPAFFAKDFLVRATGLNGLPQMNWSFQQWPSLFMSWQNDLYGMDISMVSAFVTVPEICLLGLLNTSMLKKYWIWFVAISLSFILAAGSTTFVYSSLISLFPFFSLSRFPSSDYRGLIGFFVIVLAALLLRSSQERPSKKLLLRLSVIPLSFVLGFLVKLFSVRYQAKEFVMTGFLTVGSILVISYSQRSRMKAVLGLLLMLLISGFYTLEKRATLTWKVPGDLNSWYKKELHIDTREVLPIASYLHHFPASRGPRMEVSSMLWRGFMTGEYVLLGNHFMLKQHKVIGRLPMLANYMRKLWTPLIVKNLKKVSCSSLPSESELGVQVEQTSYGLNKIVYQVHATQNFALVENEVFFPGWFGRSSLAKEVLTSSNVCGALRAWSLPSGNYEFVTEFEMPAFLVSAILSGASLVIYLGFLLLGLFQRRTSL